MGSLKALLDDEYENERRKLNAICFGYTFFAQKPSGIEFKERIPFETWNWNVFESVVRQCFSQFTHFMHTFTYQTNHNRNANENRIAERDDQRKNPATTATSILGRKKKPIQINRFRTCSHWEPEFSWFSMFHIGIDWGRQWYLPVCHHVDWYTAHFFGCALFWQAEITVIIQNEITKKKPTNAGKDGELRLWMWRR